MEVSPTVVELVGADQLALWPLTVVAMATPLLVAVAEPVRPSVFHGATVHQFAKASIIIQ